MSTLRIDVSCHGDAGFQLQLACDIATRGVTAIYGPSGSGKSTLLDCIAGLRDPAAGSSLRFGDSDWLAGATPPWQRRVGYVFQDARLFPHLDVRENLLYGAARNAGMGEAVQDTITLEDVCGWLSLSDLLDKMPERLSAGQGQRVAIGRALLSNPRLLLLDEPLANLDQLARQQCLAYLRRAADALHLPMLYVSHDIEEVSNIADHVLLLAEGKLVDQGPLVELSCRLDTRLSHEEQAAAILSATVSAHDQQFGLSQLQVDGQALFVNLIDNAPGEARRVRIPARDVSICRERPTDTSILNIFSTRVDAIENSQDSRLLVRLALGEQFLLARITRKSVNELSLKVGDEVFAQVKSTALIMGPGQRA